IVEELPETKDDMSRYTHVEPFEIEFGYGLIPLVDNSNGDDVLERVLQVRHQIAQELGIVVQPIRLRGNLQLAPNQYVIKIRGNSVGSGEIYPGQYLVMNPFGDEIDLDGIDTVEPSFGLKAKWVNEKLKGQAEDLSYTTVDDLTVLITHLKEIIRLHASELLGRNELKTALDKIKEEYPGFVDDIIPNIISLSDVLKVLKNLLKENVPVKDLFIILETLADFGQTTKDIELLTEYVRHRLGRTIAGQYVNERGVLEVISLSPQLEQVIFSNLQRSFQGSFPALAPDMTTQIFQSIQFNLDRAMMEQKSPVILASPNIRVAFRHLIQMNFHQVPVLSLNDIPNNINIDVIGMVNTNES
ncbi:MAG: FHIPEP family type III secretion protein, partial [Turicibacter sp.]|nr:FHIPEP family type III secretion protein [Turicibacter sp.]